MGNPADTCISCGYDLAATPAGAKCPECGRAALIRRDVLDGSALKDRRGHWVAVACAVLGVLVVATVCSGVLSPFF